MCAVSMVSEHYHSKFPDYQTFPPTIYPDYQELIRKARLYDEMTNQKDCQDPMKAEWEEKLKKFMKDTYGLNAST